MVSGCGRAVTALGEAISWGSVCGLRRQTTPQAARVSISLETSELIEKFASFEFRGIIVISVLLTHYRGGYTKEGPMTTIHAHNS